MGKVLHMIKSKAPTDNYFRVGRRVFFFSSQDIARAHFAWDAAVAYQRSETPQLPDVSGFRRPGPPIAVFRPFGIDGPWTNVAEVIGFMPAGERPSVERQGVNGVVETWIERTEMRKLLWNTGAWHVDGQGYPLAGG